jgi:hypothetical protein
LQHRDLAAPPAMGSAAARDGGLGRVLFASESYLLHTRLEDGNSVVTDTVYREQRAVGSERFLRASSRQVRAREQLRQASSAHSTLLCRDGRHRRSLGAAGRVSPGGDAPLYRWTGDVRIGSVVLPAGCRLRARDVALTGAVGCRELPVRKRLCVGACEKQGAPRCRRLPQPTDSWSLRRTARA